MLSRRGWFLPGVLSIVAHVSVFTVMPSASKSAAVPRSVLMRVQDPPPPPPQPEKPAAQVVVKKEPPPKKIVKPPPKEPEPVALPPPAPAPAVEKPIETAAPPKTTDQVAAPGPSTALGGTGPAAGNGAMLGESRPPTTNVAEGVPSTEKRDGATRAADAKRDLQGYHRRIFEAVKNGANYYPSAAKRLGLEGRARIQVTIDRQGRITNKKLLQSTGHELLDRRAMELIEEAAPFGPLPDTYDAKEADFIIPVTFRLTGAE